MQKYAEVLARGEPEEVVVRTVYMESKKLRFEHEEKMKKMEMEMRLSEMAAEKEKLAARKKGVSRRNDWRRRD